MVTAVLKPSSSEKHALPTYLDAFGRWFLGDRLVYQVIRVLVVCARRMANSFDLLIVWAACNGGHAHEGLSEAIEYANHYSRSGL